MTKKHLLIRQIVIAEQKIIGLLSKLIIIFNQEMKNSIDDF